MKFGFVSLPVAGHLNPMTALARKLQSHGNEVVFFGVPDVEPIVRSDIYTHREALSGGADFLRRVRSPMRACSLYRYAGAMNFAPRRIRFE
jgi:hypothetical protein